MYTARIYITFESLHICTKNGVCRPHERKKEIKTTKKITSHIMIKRKKNCIFSATPGSNYLRFSYIYKVTYTHTHAHICGYRRVRADKEALCTTHTHLCIFMLNMYICTHIYTYVGPSDRGSRARDTGHNQIKQVDLNAAG